MTPTYRLRCRHLLRHRMANRRCKSRCPMATSTSTATITITTARATATATAQDGGLFMDPIITGGFGLFFPGNTGSTTNGRSANVYLQSMADAANDGYFVPEQVWDRPDIAASQPGDRWAARLLSTRLRANTSASSSRLTPVTTSTHRLSSRPNIAARARYSAPPANALTTPARAQTSEQRSRFSPATRPLLRVGPGTATTARFARSTSVWTSLAARLSAERRFSSGTATAQALRNGAGDNRPDS
jgi:hypothetical protein